MSRIVLSLLFGLSVLSTSAQTPDYWLSHHQLEVWDLPFDHDGDGFSTEEEYYAGTDPLDASSFLSLDIARIPSTLNFNLQWQSGAGAQYQLMGTTDLETFDAVTTTINGDGSFLQIPIPYNQGANYFHLQTLPPHDLDNDGLSSVEEAILGTNPLSPDTDGDTLTDSDEVFSLFTDPLVPDSLGGTVRGTLYSDPNNDGDFADGSPIPNATIYLDANYNGTLDSGERTTATDENGDYEFIVLAPGLYHVRQDLPASQIQTAPPLANPPAFDFLPDEVVEYIHDNPDVDGFTGNFNEPYGIAASDLPSSWGLIQVGLTPVLIDPDVVLKPIGVRNKTQAGFLTKGTEFLTIPLDGSLTVRFDEPIIDGPGPDLLIHSLGDSSAGETAELYLGSDEDNLTFASVILESDGTIPVDLENRDIPTPIQYLRIKALDSLGTLQGFELVGIEAVNIAVPNATSHIVTITENEVFEDRDFGRYFQDNPPNLVLGRVDEAPLTPGFRSGEHLTFRLNASDDFGLTSTALFVDGQPVTLDEDLSATIPLTKPGILYATASATDTAGQTTTEIAEYVILNSDGSFPLDPNLIGTSESSLEAPTIRITSPATGSDLASDTPLIGSIITDSAAISWSIEYAPIDLVDPYQLSSADPDYLPLASGTSNIYNDVLTTLPVTSLADGIYFLRIAASGTATPTAYYGQVFAKNISSESLRPQITLTGPTSGSEVMLTTNLTGTITSDRPLREWSIDYAPAELIDPNNIGAPNPAWIPLASGTDPFETDSLLATFDSTLVKSGSYIFRVSAFNDIGLGWAEPLLLEAVGNSKFGRNRLEFADFSLDLAGIPLSFTRVYDSLQSGEFSDLGYGWSLKLQDPDIQETVPDTAVSGFFGATPYRNGTRIYLNAPGGERLGFTFNAEPVAASFIGALSKATFTPDPGIYHSLEVPEGDEPFLSLADDGSVSLFFFNFPYNPSEFILTEPGGNKYTYDEDLGFIRAEDPNGNTLTWSEDRIVHSSGLSIEMERDPQGRITSMTAPNGDQWTFTYDGKGDLVTSTDPDHFTTTYTYLDDPAHYLSGLQDPLGNFPVRYEYDPEDGRLIAEIDPNGNRTEVSWDPGSFTGSTTSSRGFTTTLRYNERGNIIEETNPDGHLTTYTYDDPDNPDKETSVTDANGHTISYSYDNMGNALTVSPPAGIDSRTKITRTYDSFGNLTSENDLTSRQSDFTFDSKGNLISENPAFGPDRTFTRTSSGQLSQIHIGNQYTRTGSFDSDGLISGITDNLGFELSMTMGKNGYFSSITNADGQTATFTFDSDGVATSQTDFYGNSKTTTRPAYNTYLIDGPGGDCEEITFDANNNPSSLSQPSGGVITTDFNPAGNLSSLTDSLGNLTTYDYDFADRITGITDPHGNAEIRTFNKVGLLESVTTRSGKKRTFTHDALGRLVTETWLDSSDNVIRTITRSYTAWGSLSQVTDTAASGTTTHAFNNPLTQPDIDTTTVTYPGQAPMTVSASYFADSIRQQHPVSINLSTEATRLNFIRAAYVGNELFELTWTDNPADSDDDRLEFRRYPNGSTQSITRYFDNSPVPNSITNFTYNPHGPVASITHLDGSSQELDPRANIQYGFNADNRISTITNGTNTSTITYDTSSRLTGVTHSNASLANENYSYDSMSNRLTSHLAPSTHTISTGNVITNDGVYSYSHDLDGNVASRTNLSTNEVREFSYDHRNQLEQILIKPDSLSPAATTIRFAYDYLGRLACREINGTKTWIVYDRQMPIGEFLNGNSALSAAFFYNPATLDDFHAVWRTGSGVSWFLKDSIGSVRGILNDDGSLRDWRDYDAFGNQISGTDQEPVSFAGRFHLAEANLYENRLRFLDPQLGRFLSPDPLGFAAGQLNLYAYVGNDPLNFTDPSGTVVAIQYEILADLIFAYYEPLCRLGDCVADMYFGIATAVEFKRPVEFPSESCVGAWIPETDPGKILKGKAADKIKDKLPKPVQAAFAVADCVK